MIHAMKKGFRKNVVILTRNYGYRKEKPGKSKALYVAAFREYPQLLNTLLNRYRSYNRTLDLIEKWENEGHIFVIRPEMEPVGRAERDEEKLAAFYQHGYDLMKEKMTDMMAYLKEGHIFVIRPEMEPVGRAERDEEKLAAFYQHGYDLMKEKMTDMMAYLKQDNED